MLEVWTRNTLYHYVKIKSIQKTEADKCMSASVKYKLINLILNERRFEEEVVLGKSGKTEAIKVYKWLFAHEELFADASA